MADESATTILLRRSDGDQDLVLRTEIASVNPSSLSAMPEGLEQDLSIEQMADLLQFLKSLAFRCDPRAGRR